MNFEQWWKDKCVEWGLEHDAPCLAGNKACAKAGYLAGQADTEKAHLQTIDERDEAQQAVSQIYFIVTGESPEWSNNFDYEQAYEAVKEAMELRKQHFIKEGQASKQSTESEVMPVTVGETIAPLTSPEPQQNQSGIGAQFEQFFEDNKYRFLKPDLIYTWTQIKEMAQVIWNAALATKPLPKGMRIWKEYCKQEDVYPRNGFIGINKNDYEQIQLDAIQAAGKEKEEL